MPASIIICLNYEKTKFVDTRLDSELPDTLGGVLASASSPPLLLGSANLVRQIFC
jgi:hypothetical protein